MFNNTFHGITHGNCVRHHVGNFEIMIKCPKYVEPVIWEAAKTFDNGKFEAIMERIHAIDDAGYK